MKKLALIASVSTLTSIFISGTLKLSTYAIVFVSLAILLLVFKAIIKYKTTKAGLNSRIK